MVKKNQYFIQVFPNNVTIMLKNQLNYLFNRSISIFFLYTQLQIYCLTMYKNSQEMVLLVFFYLT